MSTVVLFLEGYLIFAGFRVQKGNTTTDIDRLYIQSQAQCDNNVIDNGHSTVRRRRYGIKTLQFC